MSLFFQPDELAAIKAARSDPSYADLYWGLLNRVQSYTTEPSLGSRRTTVEWWHHAAECLSEAAALYKLTQDEQVGTWLRSAALAITRRGVDDWIGPSFRPRSQPARGSLETAHLAIGLALALDLGRDLFEPGEIREITARLQETAIPLCLAWLQSNKHLANWRCIMTAGAAAAAAVLNNQDVLTAMKQEYNLCLQALQPDGSYAESLQYSSYGCCGLMITFETLVRSNPERLSHLTLAPYAKAVHWYCHSLFYRKPLSGWGAYPLPRSANFNDSAAVFAPDGDLLLQIAARAGHTMPTEAGLARWLFDTIYGQNPGQGPFDRNSFGFFNRYSCLSLLFYPQAVPASSPAELSLPTTARFSNGHCLTRSSWENNRTALAFSGAADPLHAPGHLHADLNSMILIHNQERLLADPGHTCYRSFIHEYDCATKAHNTCTFHVAQPDDLQTNEPQAAVLQQRSCGKRSVGSHRQLAPPVHRPGTFLIAADCDDLTVFGSDAAAAYGAPLKRFERFLILCGSHALFVIDRISASEPILTSWNWLLNNRDGSLEYKSIHPDKLVARRGNAGMKLFHFGAAALTGPLYGHIHDAYHPLPQQLGEGSPGTGLHFVWTDARANQTFVRVHGIAVDTYGLVSRWHLRQESASSYVIEGPDRCCNWQLSLNDDDFGVTETVAGRRFTIHQANQAWQLNHA